MAEEGRKVAKGLGVAAILGGAILLATKVRAAPPEPPEPPEPGLANLYGVVTDTVTGGAVPGVLITLNGIETFTFDDGSYSLVDLEPRGYDIVFSKEGYEPFDLFNVAIIEGNNKLNVELTPIAPPEPPEPPVPPEPPEPPAPPEPAWAVSGITIANASLPTWCPSCWMLCSLSVTNTSGSSVPCPVALYARYFSSATDYKWTDWRELLPKNLSSYRNAVSDYQPALDKYNQLTILDAVLAPGETRVFSGVVPNITKSVTGTPRQWVKFVGPFGEVLASSYFPMVEY